LGAGREREKSNLAIVDQLLQAGERGLNAKSASATYESGKRVKKNKLLFSKARGNSRKRGKEGLRTVHYQPGNSRGAVNPRRGKSNYLKERETLLLVAQLPAWRREKKCPADILKQKEEIECSGKRGGNEAQAAEGERQKKKPGVKFEKERDKEFLGGVGGVHQKNTGKGLIMPIAKVGIWGHGRRAEESGDRWRSEKKVHNWGRGSGGESPLNNRMGG